jgi:predicted dinucleotide-binding enzyme
MVSYSKSFTTIFMKTIGIIGSGTVAKSLAKGFLGIGYSVMMGTRDITKLSDMEGVKKGSVRESCQYSDLLVLAVKGVAALEVLKEEDISGKTIIDTTNPIADLPPVNGVIQFFTAANHSLGQQLQSSYPQANFVKAFNSVGSRLMVHPDMGGIQPSMFICGNSSESKVLVSEIINQFGWEVEDMGQIESCGAIESLCMLWCIRGFKENKWEHAFKLLKL